jgi:hypothetical protein
MIEPMKPCEFNITEVGHGSLDYQAQVMMAQLIGVLAPFDHGAVLVAAMQRFPGIVRKGLQGGVERCLWQAGALEYNPPE